AEVVRMNLQAVDNTLENLHKVDIPQTIFTDAINRVSTPHAINRVSTLNSAPEFVREVLGKIMVWEGDDLPVSTLPVDGTFPVGTAKWEKRNVAEEIPVWEPDVCVHCGKCVMVCP
ncbi:MAG: 4Fe-4S binding protein, partial [Nostoc sp.]